MVVLDFDRRKPRNKTEQGNKSEERVLKSIRRVHRSGAGWTKGDIHTADLHVEVKHTTAQSFAVSRKLWDKVRRQALRSMKDPALMIEFEDGPTLIVQEGVDG